jgi:hypothetical protein
MQKGIFWLTLPDQNPPVPSKFNNVARHFHVTLQFGVELTLEIREMLGKTVEATAVANCYNNQIQALRVSLPEEVRQICNNENPHMTISMADGVKPVESNNMLKGDCTEIPLSIPINLRFDFFLFG